MLSTCSHWVSCTTSAALARGRGATRTVGRTVGDDRQDLDRCRAGPTVLVVVLRGCGRVIVAVGRVGTDVEFRRLAVVLYGVY